MINTLTTILLRSSQTKGWVSKTFLKVLSVKKKAANKDNLVLFKTLPETFENENKKPLTDTADMPKEMVEAERYN